MRDLFHEHTNKKARSRALLTAAAGLALLGCRAADTPAAHRPGPSTLPAPARARSPLPQAADAPVVALPNELQAYVQYGLEHNGELRAAFEGWRAAEQAVLASDALPEPRLTYAEFLEEIQTRTGPQERRFSLMQAFPWPGTLGARKRVAQGRADVLREHLTERRAALIQEIEVTYHDYALVARELAISSELLGLLQQLDPVVQARIQGGGRREDLLRLQVEVGRVGDDVARLRRRLPAAARRLAAAMNYSGAELPPPELLEPEAAAQDPEELEEALLAESPELLRLQRERELASEALELSRFAGRPQLAFGVDYFETGDAVNPGISGSGDDPVALSLSVSLPLWGGAYSAERREARHRLRGAQARLADLQHDLRGRLEELLFQLEDADRRLRLYRDVLLPRSREALELTLASYRTGAGSLLDLLDAERSLLQFELAYWRACADHHKSSARLAALLGEGVQ